MSEGKGAVLKETSVEVDIMAGSPVEGNCYHFAFIVVYQ